MPDTFLGHQNVEKNTYGKFCNTFSDELNFYIYWRLIIKKKYIFWDFKPQTSIILWIHQ